MATRPAVKTPVKTSVVRQPHGGALRVGNPGNPGGGRLKSEVREAALAGARQAVPRLIKLLKTGDDGVKVKAADILLKYGVGPTNAMPADEVRANLEATIAALRDEYGDNPQRLELFLMQRLKPIWV